MYYNYSMLHRRTRGNHVTLHFKNRQTGKYVTHNNEIESHCDLETKHTHTISS